MKLTELKSDNRNANKGTKRGRQLVQKSLEDFGSGRSILIDRDGRIIAGNKTVEGATLAGLDDVVVVQTDGTKIVAVQRTDISLDDAKGRGLAVADNRTAELGLEWDSDVLLELAGEIDMQPYFTTEELGKLKVLPVDADDASDQSGDLSDTYSVLVTLADEASQLELLEKLTNEGYECRSLIA